MNLLLKNTLKLGLSVASACHLTSLYRRNSPGACVLFYHGLSNGKNRGLENQSRLHMDVHDFRASLEIFAKHYNVISLQELTDRIEAGDDIENNTMVLTFDDGYASNFHIARPLLEEFGMHATIFVSTGFIEGEMFQWPDRVEYALDKTPLDTLELDFPHLPVRLDISSQIKKTKARGLLDVAVKSIPQEQYLEGVAHIEERAGVSLAEADQPADIYKPMTWAQVRELEASEFISIGAHTHRHIILGKTDPDFARADMQHSIELLRTKGGVNNPTFAYPNGQPGDFNETTRQILKDVGISVAVTTVVGSANNDSDLLEINRVCCPKGRFEADTLCYRPLVTPNS